MKTVRFDKPPISFNPYNLFIEKQNDVYHKIFADGFEIGYIITRNNEWVVQMEKYILTDNDKEFLIDAAKQL
ncbi:hypothetical protein [Mucilaginibacter sp. FT3.2]|uniref:hypothetical protein n=1 Tax=Mucilaginibacter sp. FT3.2 TaxID=2723090 RepID=UPI0016144722|nr:hypothetical protein [Mucilaginibacter sp. FT3.2]MBB6232986.1 hypothetical protein [Mucilaginibacter sp. FT3.2]